MEIRRCWTFASISEARLALVAASVALGFAACGKPSPDERALPLVRVNSHLITVLDFERSYVLELMSSGANDTEEARHMHLDRLIDDYLLFEEAGRRGLGKDSIAKAHESLAVRSALGGRYYERELLQKLPPLTDVEIRRAYAHYKQPVIARHIYYRNESDAQAAYMRLEAGRPFLDEAMDCFQTSDTLAGYLGVVGYFQVDDAFAEAAFKLDVGTYSAPVRSRQGYHIIRIEDRQHAPVLTESDYQTRKSGIASMLRLRRRRLEGDRYVQEFMQGLDVQVSPNGIRALHASLSRFEKRAGRVSVNIETDTEARPLTLTPETPLATYAQYGNEQVFTALDYLFWLPSLPFSEATQRTAASVGRALRNEAFARVGEATDLASSDEVKADVEDERRMFMAARMRAQGLDSILTATLRQSAAIQVDSALFEQIMAF